MGKAKWWVCDDCKSLNDLPANKCYGCRVAKPAAPSLIDDQYGEVRGGPQKRVGISVDMALVPGLVARDPLEHYKGGDIIEAYGVDDDEPLASSSDSLQPATPPPPMRAPTLRSIAEIGGEHWDPPSVSPDHVSPDPSPTVDLEPEAVPGAAAAPSAQATPSAPTASAPPPSPRAGSSAPPPIPGQAPPPGYLPPPGAPQGGPQVRPASPLPPPPGVRPPPPLGVAPPPPIGYRPPLPYPPPPMPPGAQRLPPPPLPPGRQAPPPPPMAQRSPAGSPSTPPAAPDPTDSSDE